MRCSFPLRTRLLPYPVHSMPDRWGRTRPSSLAFFLFVLAQFLHGLFQSTGGPVNTSIMGNWFPKKGRGLIFGLWTCHQYIGDFVAFTPTLNSEPLIIQPLPPVTPSP